MRVRLIHDVLVDLGETRLPRGIEGEKLFDSEFVRGRDLLHYVFVRFDDFYVLKDGRQSNIFALFPAQVELIIEEIPAQLQSTIDEATEYCTESKQGSFRVYQAPQGHYVYTLPRYYNSSLMERYTLVGEWTRRSSKEPFRKVEKA